MSGSFFETKMTTMTIDRHRHTHYHSDNFSCS